ncbi:hypothetical protein SPBRAN_1282 [uncultured Candidatus Thioglobus sp.]|nr:hypothetical protein SPBRAN_1282 [uncultured Candidatus Thioglobus sp.]
MLKKIVIKIKVVNKLITLGRGLLSVSLSTLPLALLWWGVTDPLSWLFVGILCGFLLYTVITSSPYNLSKWLLPMDIIAPVAFAPMLLFIWHNAFSSFDGFVYFFCFNSIPYYCIWLLKYYYIRRLRHDQSSDLESPIQPPPDDQKIMIEVVNTLITLGRGWFGFHLTILHFSLFFVGDTKQSSWLHASILFMLFLHIISTSSPDNLSKWLLPMDIIAPVAMGVVYITMLLMEFMGHSPSYAMSIFFPAVIIPYYCIWLLKYYYIRRLRHDQSSDLESPI